MSCSLIIFLWSYNLDASCIAVLSSIVLEIFALFAVIVTFALVLVLRNDLVDGVRVLDVFHSVRNVDDHFFPVKNKNKNKQFFVSRYENRTSTEVNR